MDVLDDLATDGPHRPCARTRVFPTETDSYRTFQEHLTLRSATQERVSKGGYEHYVCCPSFETALWASSG